MTPPSKDRDDIAALQGSDVSHSGDIESLQQELAATNVLLVALKQELSSDRVETAVRVEGLRAEQNRERRVRMMAVSALGLGSFYAYDLQIEHCSPGARVTHAVDYLVSHPPKPGDSPAQRQADFLRQYDSAPAACDVTMPLHTHDGSDYPTPQDVLGGVVLGVLALAVAIYHRFRTRRDYLRVSEVAMKEEKHGLAAGPLDNH